MSRLRSVFPFLLAGVAAGGILTGLVMTAGPADAQDDPRQPITVHAMQRDHLLAEMRGMLTAVNGVLRGVTAGDTALVRTSAASAGMAAMQTQMRGRGMGMGPMGRSAPMGDSALRARHDSMMAGGMMGRGMGMGARMPQAFRQLMMGTHLAFDSLSTIAADARAPRDTMVARIANITSNCVSCHAMYRLETR